MKLTNENIYDIACNYQKEILETGNVGKLCEAIRDAQHDLDMKPVEDWKKGIANIICADRCEKDHEPYEGTPCSVCLELADTILTLLLPKLEEAKREGCESVLVYLDNDYPDEAESIRKALKEE
jgi:hypothetical protein